jgi:hypothetical protein
MAWPQLPADEKGQISKIMVKSGADLPSVLNNIFCGSSLLTLMYSTGPTAFVHDFVYGHIGLGEYWAMTPVNSWIIRTVARSDPRVAAKLRVQERELRSLSCGGQANGKAPLLDFSVDTQLTEMQSSSVHERHSYIKAMCAGGAASELGILLAHPAQIPELSLEKDNADLLRSYLTLSAMCGNMETFSRLLDMGLDFNNHPEVWFSVSGVCTTSTHFNNCAESNEIRRRMMERLLSTFSPELSAFRRPYQQCSFLPRVSIGSISPS